MGALSKNQGAKKPEVRCSHLASEAGAQCCQVYVAGEGLGIVLKCIPRKSEVQQGQSSCCHCHWKDSVLQFPRGGAMALKAGTRGGALGSDGRQGKGTGLGTRAPVMVSAGRRESGRVRAP